MKSNRGFKCVIEPIWPLAFPKRDLRNMTTPDRGVIAVADLACGNPGPMVGAPGRVSGKIFARVHSKEDSDFDNSNSRI
ncbi:hypothetical protein PAPYR_5783 [Paratrimastix pyriformis]|uniref:Uncharacterized protein n=1 Tax=Paratrimastix pyriformis TaxID=342808 RepID=A0ABQ8UNU4_9EUKA|nr:hypothetical protein PAPYR_5783 [Paratrimastix pyriformis]